MGFARRVVRKTVRKATPRPVRRAMHPVRTARYAVTPRPVRQVSRAVYTVTNPLGAAENALIGAALNGGRSRQRRAAPRRSSGRPVADTAGPTAGQLRAAAGAQAQDRLAELMAVQRARFEPARPPVIPPPVPADPSVLFAQEWAQRRWEVRFWQRRRRRELRAEIQAHAQMRAAQLTADTHAAYVADQARADNWWSALNAGDPAVVTHALGAAFADNPAPVTILTAGGQEASLLVWLPGIDVLPDRRPHITPGGRLSTKAWTKTELNDAYADLLGAHLLATLRETWAVAPSLAHVRVTGAVRTPSAVHVLFCTACARDSEQWSSDAAGARLLGTSGGLIRAGRTREVRGWPADKIPGDVAAHLHPR